MNFLVDKLLEDATEREHTLNQIERGIFISSEFVNLSNKSIFSMYSIPMVYSIWEGYVRLSFTDYLNTLNSLNLRLEELADPVKIFWFEGKFKQIHNYPQNEKKKIKLINDLNSSFSEQYVVLEKNFNLENNVGFDVLNGLLSSTGLEKFKEDWGEYTRSKGFSLKQKLESFLNDRNKIAHGAAVPSTDRITQEIYSEYKQLILNLMFEIILRIENGLISKSYLK